MEKKLGVGYYKIHWKYGKNKKPPLIFLIYKYQICMVCLYLYVGILVNVWLTRASVYVQ